MPFMVGISTARARSGWHRVCPLWSNKLPNDSLFCRYFGRLSYLYGIQVWHPTVLRGLGVAEAPCGSRVIASI